jgi:predicted nucleotidyltransferase component of viral defense system
MSGWQDKHERVIFSFLSHLNENSDGFVLKGGTALLACYGLKRFSEVVDLDGTSDNIKDVVESFCEKNGYSYRVAKDTETVKRYMIHYGNDDEGSKPLKVETSYRKKEIAAEETAKINGILTYNIDTLCMMKSNAYVNRDKIRDLYDLSFICNNHFDKLSPHTISVLRNAIEYKGIDQFDYVIKEQNDPLINSDKLMDDFLSMYDRLGLLYNEKERQTIIALKDEMNNA